MAIPSQSLDTRDYLCAQVFPALTPLAVGPGHPFPHVREGSLNIAVIIDGRTRDGSKPLAVIEVPTALESFSAQIATHVANLFPGFRVREVATFRIDSSRRLETNPSASAEMIERLADLLSRR